MPGARRAPTTPRGIGGSVAGQLAPHRGMCAWARPQDNTEGTETKRRVRKAVAPSPCQLGGMQPGPGTSSYEYTTIDEQGTG